MQLNFRGFYFQIGERLVNHMLLWYDTGIQNVCLSISEVGCQFWKKRKIKEGM